MNFENLSFSLEENNNNNKIITEDDLMDDMENIEMSNDFTTEYDDFYAQEINYDTNYTKKELERIASYYEIPKRRKNKSQLIEEIILFEKTPDNICFVLQRKKFWQYIKELKEDNYLRQFIIFD
jgi:hypothetical protein|uniref:Uncharacterized protein n=1 Tax=viral metagenome TaxID=1070528 RepID=A0A6C0C0W8_9ZZZZ